MMAEAVVGQWQWQLLLGTRLFVVFSVFSMSHSGVTCPLLLFWLFVFVYILGRCPRKQKIRSSQSAHFLMSWAGRVHLYSHLLMSNLQACMLTYMGTLMYMITGIYNVFVSHISSLSIYIYILFKDIYNFCLYYSIYLIQKIPMYTYPSQPYTVELIPWVIEVGLFSLGTAGGILRPSSVICTETCYDGTFHSLQGCLPRKGRQSCTCACIYIYIHTYLYLHTGITYNFNKTETWFVVFCNYTRTERYAHVQSHIDRKAAVGLARKALFIPLWVCTPKTPSMWRFFMDFFW